MSRLDWQRVRGLAGRLTTPLHPDDYLSLINPLWSARELRGRIEKVVPETEDAATLAIRPGWGWSFDHQAGQYVGIGVEIDGRFHWRSYSLSSVPRRDRGRSRSPCARCRRGSSPTTSCAASRRGPSCGWPLRPASSPCPTRRPPGPCSWSAAAVSPR